MRLLAFGLPHLELLADLHGVAVHRDSPLEELDIGDGEGDCLTPPQTRERQDEHKIGVPARLLGQPAHVRLGQVDVPLGGFLGLLAALESARGVERERAVHDRVVEDSRQYANRAVHDARARAVAR